MLRSLSLTLLIFLSSKFVIAAEFVKINIPGAKCGNGENYAVYFKSGHSKKLLIELQGGGACWDYQSCFATPMTSLSPLSKSPKSFLSSNDSKNPFRSSSMLYIPYCTGDVFIGKHIALYKDKTVYHYGNINFQLTFKHLSKEKMVDFKRFKNVTVWGASAGAIGSLIQATSIEPYLLQAAVKNLILDSAGLHFGKNFWDKFSKNTEEDFKDALGKIGITPDFQDGFIAKDLRPTLEIYEGWKLGFLIATKDKVMSSVFGNISPEDHKKLVLSPEGLPALARDFPHVHVWLKDSEMHTFLVSKMTAKMESVDKEKAMYFVRDLISTPL